MLYRGKDVHALKGSELFAYKREAQMVFQDPYASLDPRMTVSDIIAEGMDVHHLYQNKAERAEKIYGLLEKVGLNKEHANRFIHEFSGGQRQRIGIARALAMEPRFLVMDEPISALDVSIQAQVINMLIRLQKEMGLTYLFVAHDLSMVKHISDRVAVMYLGQIVEIPARRSCTATRSTPIPRRCSRPFPSRTPLLRPSGRPSASIWRARSPAPSTRLPAAALPAAAPTPPPAAKKRPPP